VILPLSLAARGKVLFIQSSLGIISQPPQIHRTVYVVIEIRTSTRPEIWRK
jgi:hypothetical protein